MATNNVQLSRKKKAIEKENAFWNKEIKWVESCSFIDDGFKARVIIGLNGKIKLTPVSCSFIEDKPEGKVVFSFDIHSNGVKDVLAKETVFAKGEQQMQLKY